MSRKRFEGLPAALRLLRRRAGINQTELAERAGLGKGTVNSYEKGRVVPSLEGLEKILTALNATLLDLQAALYSARGETPPPIKPLPPQPDDPEGPEDELVAAALVHAIQYLSLASGFAIYRYLSSEAKKPLP